MWRIDWHTEKKWITGPHRGRFGDSSFSFFRRGECGWRGIHRKNEVQVMKPIIAGWWFQIALYFP